jgi:hypothetical protein
MVWGCLRYSTEELGIRVRKFQEDGEDCISRSFITCMLYHMLLGWSDKGG